MREITGDLWAQTADALVIPTNWTFKKNGSAVMGAGVAKQAAERYPWLPARLGATIDRAGEPNLRAFPTADHWLVAFPTKDNWRHPSSLDLIEDLLPSLLHMAEHHHWQTIVLPRLGCGLGGLAWSDVQPVLERYLDDRFVVVTGEDAYRGKIGTE